jgi:uroporphyrin-III C-methyltransferase
LVSVFFSRLAVSGGHGNKVETAHSLPTDRNALWRNRASGHRGVGATAKSSEANPTDVMGKRVLPITKKALRCTIWSSRPGSAYVCGMDSVLQPGRVILVGAGPGAADLLTIRAARALAAADVVVHDGLVGADVVALVPASTRRISVAKQRARHTMPQDAIGELLVAEARAGNVVVRLKGGDPLIFGRGGEEVEACTAAGVAVEVIPGVSSALGAAAAAQMPLTHRDHASIVSFVAGECRGLADQNWVGLAGKDRTLVIYMGVTGAERIAEKLIADGLSPDTPVAILERATHPDMRVLRSLLADLGGIVARAAVRSPALIIVGDVARLGDAAITQVAKVSPCPVS